MSVQRPVFTIRFTQGLATRNRLPLEHVIRVLNEIKGMIEEVGKRVQREHGIEQPTGDFGLELVAGFKRGSVQANVVMTRDTAIGAQVVTQILDTVNRLSAKPQSRQKPEAVRQSLLASDYDPRIVGRLNNIGKVQEIDKTLTELSLRTNGRRAAKAVLNARAVKTVTELREPNFEIDGVTVYGKLRELRERITR